MSKAAGGNEKALASSRLARRRFLVHGAATVAAASATSLNPATTSELFAAAAHRPNDCSNILAPLENVEGKVAFITGGSSGIGLGIARAFTDAGMKVVIGYRTKEHLDEALNYLKDASSQVHVTDVDVRDRAAMERAAAETMRVFGKVHVLVNNAGVLAMAPLGKTTYEDWDWIMDVNLNGVFNGLHAFLPLIQAHGEGGHIIAAASILGLFNGGAAAAAYSVSKFAVVGMMEALRAELAETNIGVSVYCPGTVNSNIMDADRNRPKNLENIGPSLVRKPNVTAKSDQNLSTPSMTPLEAGKLVLRGMRNNDLYILTHPEYKRIIQMRGEVLLASIPDDLRPISSSVEEARSLLQHSIYADELSHRRCARRPET